MAQPEMFDDGSGRVWRLRKALYGLKQAAREWHKALAALLHEMGYKRSHSDPALYVHTEKRVFVFLWVDDLIILGAQGIPSAVAQEVLSKFQGRDFGGLEHVLGMEIKKRSQSKDSDYYP